MKKLTMDVEPSRARSLITTALVALGFLFLAYAADSMVSSLATASPADRFVKLSGSDVSVYNLAGKARVSAGTGASVEVNVDLEGRDADQLKLDQDPVDGHPSLRIRYPSDHVIYPAMGFGSNTTVHVRDDGTFGGKDHGWMDRGESVRISGSGSGLEAHADLDIRVPRGQRFALHLATGTVTVANVDGDLKVDTGSGTVTSTGTSGDLSIATGSGNVSVDGAKGDVKLDTGSGDVRVGGVAGDKLAVDTGSGDIHASDIGVDDLSLETGSGDVEAARVKAGRIAVDTGSGSVALGLDVMARSVAVDTGSGDVTLRVPRSAGAEFSFETGSGGLDYQDLPVELSKRRQGSYRGHFGDGSARVVVETGSGDLLLASNNEKTRR